MSAAEHTCQGLNRGAHDIVVRVVFGEGSAGCLAVCPESGRARVLGLEFLRHQFRPQIARRAQLRDLHEKVHAEAEEERETGREGVDIETFRDRGAHILDPVGQCVGQFLDAGGAGFLHVIAGNRDRIEARHLLRGEFDDIRQHGQHGTVHGHRDRHLFERDTIEQDFHVLDGIDGYSRLADVADDPFVIRIVAAMGRKVESDGQSHLPRVKILAVESI